VIKHWLAAVIDNTQHSQLKQNGFFDTYCESRLTGPLFFVKGGNGFYYGSGVSRLKKGWFRIFADIDYRRRIPMKHLIEDAGGRIRWNRDDTIAVTVDDEAVLRLTRLRNMSATLLRLQSRREMDRWRITWQRLQPDWAEGKTEIKLDVLSRFAGRMAYYRERRRQLDGDKELLSDLNSRFVTEMSQEGPAIVGQELYHILKTYRGTILHSGEGTDMVSLETLLDDRGAPLSLRWQMGAFPGNGGSPAVHAGDTVRIMAVVGKTDGLVHEEEIARLSQICRDEPRCRVDVVRPLDSDDLISRIREGVHILHYIGHGREGRWLLPNDEFAPLSIGERGHQVSLVVAQACHGDESAAALGGCALIAYDRLPDRVATDLVWPFYSELFKGQSVGYSFARVCREMARQNRLDWCFYRLYGDPRRRLLRRCHDK